MSRQREVEDARRAIGDYLSTLAEDESLDISPEVAQVAVSVVAVLALAIERQGEMIAHEIARLREMEDSLVRAEAS